MLSTPRAATHLVTSLLLLSMLGCGSGDNSTALRLEESTDVPVSFQFEATVGREPAQCGQEYTGLGESAATGQLADARMFLSNIELREDTGEWFPLTLSDNDWQNEVLALLDFEDGSAGCSESGNSQLNSKVQGQVLAGTYTALRFNIGVPFELNHVDASTADAPLNDSSMFWVWRGGYKFLRVDWMIEGGMVPRWNFHLGATGCDSATRTTAPEEPCSRPNTTTVTVELPAFEPGTDEPMAIVLDFAALLADATMLVNTGDTPPGCHSSPGEPDDCTPVFTALGLGFADGQCLNNCSDQALFSAAQ